MTMLMRNTRIGVLTAAIAACGVPMGGGESGTGMTPKTTVGKITGFGSVFVNGVEYFTTNASISSEGLRTDESALRVGMVVTLGGRVDSTGKAGVANTISFADEVEGVVTTVLDTVTNKLYVMGQEIQTDKNTIFDAKGSGLANIASLPLNAVVEVSGYTAGDGKIYATRIEVKSPSYFGQEIEIKGLVKNLAVSCAYCFNIGTTKIDYTDLVGSPLMDFTIVANQYVKIKTINYTVATNTVIAKSISLQNGGKISPTLSIGETLELEGVVTSQLAGSNFSVNGQTVVVSDPTRFNSVLIAKLQTAAALGSGISVEGIVDAQGQLVATDIEEETEDDTRYIGSVGTVDTVANSFALHGITVVTDNSTSFADNSIAQVRGFNLSYLTANSDPIEVVGKFMLNATTQAKYLQATMVKRLEIVPAVLEVSGPASATCPAEVAGIAQIAGVAIDYSSLTATVVPGTCTKATAIFTQIGGKNVASTIEFQ